MKTLLTAYLNLVKKAPEDEVDQGMCLCSVPISSLS